MGFRARGLNFKNCVSVNYNYGFVIGFAISCGQADQISRLVIEDSSLMTS